MKLLFTFENALDLMAHLNLFLGFVNVRFLELRP